MTLLIAGVVLWSIMHFIPAAAVDFRKGLIGSMGLTPYKIVFGLIMIASVFMIILGWKATAPSLLYAPAPWAGKVTFVLVLCAAVLLAAPYPRNNVKRLIRHPQLLGAAIWGIGHLLSNGDTRSIALFGGMLVWATIQILLTNRRDGPWQKPDPVPFSHDIGLFLFGAGFFALFLFTHQYLFGVSLLVY